MVLIILNFCEGTCSAVHPAAHFYDMRRREKDTQDRIHIQALFKRDHLTWRIPVALTTVAI